MLNDTYRLQQFVIIYIANQLTFHFGTCNLVEFYKLQSDLLKRVLKTKSVGLSKVRIITLDYIGIDSIRLNPVIPKIFYFKHHAGVFLIIIFIGNPDNIGNTSILKQSRN